MQIDATTFVLQLVNFVVLVWILHRFLYRPVLAAIDKRRAAIDKSMDDAKAVRAEAERLRTQFEGRLAEWERERLKARAALDAELAALRAKGLVRYTRSASWPGGKVLDPMDVPCRWFDEKATGADMIAAVEDAARTGGLLVLGFHGVGGDYLKVSAEAHAQLVAYLKQHADTIWVAPFSTVMDYVTRRPGS